MAVPGAVPQAGTMVPLGDLVQVRYVGRLRGGFNITGSRTGRSYRVPGRGQQFQVERVDIEGLCPKRQYEVKQ